MSIEYNESLDICRKVDISEVPKEIRTGITNEYGLQRSDIEIFAISNNHNNISIRMDDECSLFTSKDSTYLVKTSRGCYDISVSKIEEENTVSPKELAFSEFNKSWEDWVERFLCLPMTEETKYRADQSLVALIFEVFNNLECGANFETEELKSELLEAIEINFDYESRSIGFFSTDKLEAIKKNLNN